MELTKESTALLKLLYEYGEMDYLSIHEELNKDTRIDKIDVAYTEMLLRSLLNNHFINDDDSTPSLYSLSDYGNAFLNSNIIILDDFTYENKEVKMPNNDKYEIISLLYKEGELETRQLASLLGIDQFDRKFQQNLSNLIKENYIYKDTSDEFVTNKLTVKGYDYLKCTPCPDYYMTNKGVPLFEVWDEWITEGYCIGGILAHAYRYAKKNGESKLSCAKNIRGLADMLINDLEKKH